MAAMKRAIPSAPVLALCLTSCGTRTIPVEVRFASQALSDQANAVEVYLIDRCADATLGSIPTSARSHVAWRRGETAMALSGALPERFGVAVIARSSACEVVAAGCRDATRNDSTIVVTANAETGPGCSACSAGICMGEAADAWSASDTGTPDAPPPNTPETQCDCIDQDMDGVIDDGCLARGDGAMIWQTAFDGPGLQAFRGAARGGDGNVYINGWMTDGLVTNLCGTNYTGSGNDMNASSWTIGIDANSGSCMNVFERTSSNSVAPSSTFASPMPGPAGAWIFTHRAIVQLSAGTRVSELTLSPGANFDSGTVRLNPGTPTRMLVQIRPSGPTTTLSGMTLESSGADIVAEVNDTTVRWMRPSPTNTSVAWIDNTRWAVVSPNVAPSSCTMPATSWRIEVHDDAAMPSTCADVWGLDLPSVNASSETAIVATSSAVWTLALNMDRSYSLIATRLADGHAASFSLPSAPMDRDTLTHAVAAPDGTVFIGITKGVTGGGAEGYVYHLALDASGVRQLGMRRFGDNIVGLSVSAGNVVHASTGVSTWPLCNGAGSTLLTSDGGALVVGAIQF